MLALFVLVAIIHRVQRMCNLYSLAKGQAAIIALVRAMHYMTYRSGPSLKGPRSLALSASNCRGAHPIARRVSTNCNVFLSQRTHGNSTRIRFARAMKSPGIHQSVFVAP
jgi:hypothetical protein